MVIQNIYIVTLDKGVKITVNLSRTLYIEVPDNFKNQDIKKKVEEELVLPTHGIMQIRELLRKLNIQIPKLDIEDWSVDNVKFKVLK